MMTKNKSKQVKQLKYLLLVPVLASMLLYTACTGEEIKVDSVVQKDFKVKYLQVSSDKVQAMKSNEQSYLDLFMGFDISKYPEVSLNELSKEEKDEYNSDIEGLEKKYNQKNFFDIKVLEMNNGRKAISFIPNFGKARVTIEEVKEGSEIKTTNEDVPFTLIKKAPTFPGCADGDKDCFNKSIRKFVNNNFNTKLANSLGLSKGRKRIFLVFKIDVNGKIVKVNARAPHSRLKEEAIRIAKLLPVMKPGSYKGKNVKVAYTLPITFYVK